MTAEARSSVPEAVEKSTIEEAIFRLATEHLKKKVRNDVPPQNIIVGIESYLLKFRVKITIIKTDDSIAMMVGGHLRRLYSTEIDSNEAEKTGMAPFIRTVINLLSRTGNKK